MRNAALCVVWVVALAALRMCHSDVTAMNDLPADVRMGQLDHSSLEVSNGYVQRHLPFAANGGINVSDSVPHGGGAATRRDAAEPWLHLDARCRRCQVPV